LATVDYKQETAAHRGLSRLGTAIAHIRGNMKNNNSRRTAVRIRGLALGVAFVLVPALALGSLFPPVPGDLCTSVPFAFIVGSKVLPAGNYIVRVHNESGVVEICEEGIYCESVVSSPVEAAYAPDQPGMAFRKYGEQYFLSQIWVGGHVGRHLPDSSLQPDPSEFICTWEAAFVEARPLCIHQNAGLHVAPTWH
jgi:hypothetical protein